MYFNLKLCLLRTGLRQNQMAQAIQMDEALLSKIINGFREPNSRQRRLISEFLQQDEQWLFARNDDWEMERGRKRGAQVNPMDPLGEVGS
jgi:transcriptional regulator with XRE-family HTH domain